MIQNHKFDHRLTDDVLENITKVNKFMFIRITKTGSSSVVRNLLNPDNQLPFVVGNFEGDNRALGVLPNTLVFTTVRNPYERFVSGYNHILRHRNFAHNIDPNSKIAQFCVYKEWDLEEEFPDPSAIWEMYKRIHPNEDHTFETFFKKPTCGDDGIHVCPNQMNHLFSRQVDVINTSDILPDLIIDIKDCTKLVNHIRQRLIRISPSHRELVRIERANVHGYSLSYDDFYKKFPQYKEWVEEHFKEDFETFGHLFDWDF